MRAEFIYAEKNINCMSSSVKVVDTVQMSNLYFKD